MKVKLWNHDAGTGGGTGAGDNGNNGQGGGATNGDQSGADNRLKPGEAGYEDELARARRETADYRRRLREREQADEQADADRKRKAGEFEVLYNEAQSKVQNLTTVQAENDTLKQQLKEITDARRAELLERLPEKQRELYKGDDVTIAEIQRAVKLAGATVSTMKTSTTGAEGAANLDKEPSTMTAEELLALKQSDPAAYEKAILARVAAPRGLW